jgi:Na+/H+-translocating membrane pyrophosphatase
MLKQEKMGKVGEKTYEATVVGNTVGDPSKDCARQQFLNLFDSKN